MLSAPLKMKENLEAIGEMVNYRRWIYSKVQPHIGSSVLEAGCGNGNLSTLILQNPNVTRFVGVDHSEELCDQLRQQLHNKNDVDWDVKSYPLESNELLDLAKNPFDTIICLNVLEHIEDDGLMLKRFHDLLTPGGKVILLVPAFQWLYGSIDEIVHHHRRYSRRNFKDKIKDANFKIMTSHYFNLFGIPAWIWHGKILKLKVHRKNDMRLWDRAVPFLSKVENTLKMPLGLSLFLVAEKP